MGYEQDMEDLAASAAGAVIPGGGLIVGALTDMGEAIVDFFGGGESKTTEAVKSARGLLKSAGWRNESRKYGSDGIRYDAGKAWVAAHLGATFVSQHWEWYKDERVWSRNDLLLLLFTTDKERFNGFLRPALADLGIVGVPVSTGISSTAIVLTGANMDRAYFLPRMDYARGLASSADLAAKVAAPGTQVDLGHTSVGPAIVGGTGTGSLFGSAAGGFLATVRAGVRRIFGIG